MTKIRDDILPSDNAVAPGRCIAALADAVAEYALSYGVTDKAKAALELAARLQTDSVFVQTSCDNVSVDTRAVS
ncbi:MULTISPECIES: hypothetical protein [unclassified Yoonia]|uniref:hypothetical protein n=1 Tax=unclassified Yoonia TaxID=2629118 RepID=UPI002AFED660|nr:MULTISPECIES: hypothetical protein [unclassified Yoonia]